MDCVWGGWSRAITSYGKREGEHSRKRGLRCGFGDKRRLREASAEAPLMLSYMLGGGCKVVSSCCEWREENNWNGNVNEAR